MSSTTTCLINSNTLPPPLNLDALICNTKVDGDTFVLISNSLFDSGSDISKNLMHDLDNMELAGEENQLLYGRTTLVFSRLSSLCIQYHHEKYPWRLSGHMEFLTWMTWLLEGPGSSSDSEISTALDFLSRLVGVDQYIRRAKMTEDSTSLTTALPAPSLRISKDCLEETHRPSQVIRGGDAAIALVAMAAALEAVRNVM
ncbi:uncharacterized protein HD556DRAFT_1307220 [Suillus plorans]|uniref:Uncharacterized protein n=1 Tax=Suillus plorans TaxID=116603 RepID=A0A9P7AT13_9AGAM|nr:uncharacterized protein HD556DRAFT_1307220 [Suillus plorans]KAG1796001.1 hypothetical protein HD556DRAFT_1307220 [Suillus plorans]